MVGRLFNCAQARVEPHVCFSALPTVLRTSLISPGVFEMILAAWFSFFRFPALSSLFLYFPIENTSSRGILMQTKECRK